MPHPVPPPAPVEPPAPPADDGPLLCDPPAPPLRVPMARGQAPVRANARAGFESISAQFEVIDAPFPDVRGCSPTPHRQTLTNAAAYRLKGARAAAFSHLDRLTFLPGRPATRGPGAAPPSDSPASGELYLHGDLGQPGYVVVRGLDLRKFLFQDIVLNNCARSPERCDKERLPGPGNVWVGAEPAHEGLANEPFDSDRFSCIRNVHGYFAEFNRITKKITERPPPPSASTAARDQRRLHLTNNCREPGNYELALISSAHGKLWKNHVSLDIGLYGRVLADIAVDHTKLGTGLRVVGTNPGKGGQFTYEQIAPKRFPKGCHVANLAPYIGKAQRLRTPAPVPIDVFEGRIPYGQFSGETNAKSGLRSDEPIVYVRVEPDSAAPTHWRPHGFHFSRAGQGPTHREPSKPAEQSWSGLAKQAVPGLAIHAPHAFATFKDVQTRPFAISAFEVDGRYLGRLPQRRIRANSARLYAFDYRWLSRLTKAEVREAIEPAGGPASTPERLEIRLLDAGCAPKAGEAQPGSCVNLIVGNIVLDPGEQTSMVLGIGTQPLRDLYERNVLQRSQRYALTYDGQGHITELLSRYGLGLVIVRRGFADRAASYTVDLVSYERAVPLWRGVVQVPPASPAG